MPGGPLQSCANSSSTSPFSYLSYDATCSVIVELPGSPARYELLAVDGYCIDSVVDWAAQSCEGGNWKKRIAEDLDAAMAAGGVSIGATVDVLLRDPGTGAILAAWDVPMSHENRRRVYSVWQGDDRCP